MEWYSRVESKEKIEKEIKKLKEDIENLEDRKLQIDEQVFPKNEIYGGKCYVCGKQAEEWHHIIPKGHFCYDYDGADNIDEETIHLCKRCHMKVHNCYRNKLYETISEEREKINKEKEKILKICCYKEKITCYNIYLKFIKKLKEENNAK